MRQQEIFVGLKKVFVARYRLAAHRQLSEQKHTLRILPCQQLINRNTPVRFAVERGNLYLRLLVPQRTSFEVEQAYLELRGSRLQTIGDDVKVEVAVVLVRAD